MVMRCNLNRLQQFPTFLSVHIRNARSNPKVLALLRSMDKVIYSGLALGREEEEFALKNGVRLYVSSLTLGERTLLIYILRTYSEVPSALQ